MSVGRQVADAYIDVNGDTSSFRRSLSKLGSVIQKQQKQIDAQARALSKARAEALGKQDENYTSRMRRTFQKAFSFIRRDHDDMTRGMGASMNRLGRINNSVLGKMQKSWSRMDSTVRLVLTLIAVGADQIATLGSGLGASMTAMISSVGVALANFIPLMATIPALGLGVGLLIGSLSRLKKAGGEAAKAMKGIGLAWKNTLIPAFTKEIEGAIILFSKNLTKILDDPELGKALGKTFDGIIRGFSDVLESESMQAFMKEMKTNLPDAVEGLGRGFSKTFQGLFSLFAAAAPAAKRIGESFERWGDQFAASMDRMRKDGTLERVFDTAYTSGAALLKTTGSLGRALGTLFMIGAKYGDDLWLSFARVTDQFNDYMRTAEGQRAVNEWFSNGVRIIKAMEPLLVGAGRGMALLVNEASIKRWEGLNIQLGEFVYYASDVLRVIGQLDILGSLAALLNGLAQALSALADPFEQIVIVIGKVLRSAVDQLNRVLLVLGQSLANLFIHVGPLVDVLANGLIRAFEFLADVAIGVIGVLVALLTPAMIALSSVAETLGGWFQKVGEALGETFSKVGSNALPIVDLLAKALGAIVMAAGELLIALTPIAEVLISAFASGLELATQLLGSFGRVAGGAVASAVGSLGIAIEKLAPIIQTVAGFIAEYFSASMSVLLTIITEVSGYLGAFAQSFTGILPGILSVGSAIASVLGEAVKLILPLFLQLANTLIDLGVVIFTQLIPALGPALFGAIGGILSVIGPVVESFVQIASVVIQLAGSILGQLLPALAPLVSMVGGNLIAIFENFGPIIADLASRFSAIAAVVTEQLIPALGPAIQGIIGSLGSVFQGTLIPAIASLVGMVADLAMTFVEELLPALIPIVQNILQNLGPAIEALGGFLGIVIGAIQDVAGVVLGALLPALQPLVVVIMEVVSALVRNLGPAFEIIGNIVSFIMPLILALIGGIMANVVGVIEGVVTVIKGVVKIVKGIFTGDWAMVWEGLKDVVFGAIKAVYNFIMLWLVGRIVGVFKSIGSVILKLFGNPFKGLVALIKTPIQAVTNFIKGFMSGLKAIFTNSGGIVAGIKAALIAPFQLAYTGLLRIFAPLLSFVRTALGNIGNALKSFGGVFRTAWTKILDFLKFVGDTFKNIFGGLGGIFGNVVGSIAKVAGKVYSALKAPFTKAIDFIKGLGAQFGTIGKNLIDGLINGIKTAAGAVGAFFVTIGTNILNAIKGFFGIHSPSTVFAEIGGFLIAGLIQGVQAAVGFLVDVFTTIGESVMTAITTAFAFIGDVIGTLVQGWVLIVSTVWNTIVTAVTFAVDLVKSVITIAFDAIKLYIQTVVAIWGTIIRVAWDAIKLAVTTVVNAVKAVITAVFDAIKTYIGIVVAVWSKIISVAWDAIKTAVTTVVNTVKTVITTVFDAIKAYINLVMTGMKIVFSTVWNAIKSLITTAVNGIKSTVTTVFNAVKNVVTSVFNAVVSFVRSIPGRILSAISALSSLAGRIGGYVSQAKNAVVSKFNEVVGFVGGIPGRVLGALGNLGSLLWNAGSQIIQGFLNGLKSAFESVKNFVGGIASWIADHKGPKAVDEALLIPAGGWIMDGLRKGIEKAMPALGKTLGGVTAQIANGLNGSDKLLANAGDKMVAMVTGSFEKSKMYIAGQNAASGLADGLSASRNAIKGAIGSLSGELSISTGEVGSIKSRAIGSSRDGVESGGKQLTLAEGAIQVITPVESPRLVALEVMDEFTRFSSL